MMRPSIWTDDIFDDFMRNFDFPFFDDRDVKKAQKKLYGRRGKNIMKTDIKELDNEYRLVMDLPGFSKDEVKVSLENGYMTVSAAKGLDEDEKEKKSGKYIRQERYTGACQRSFYVGDALTQDEIKAEFKHGILKLTIPKKNGAADKYITIEG